MRRLMQGNEAVALGAWEAGVMVAAGYPGTPSTEILEYLAPMPSVYAEWSPNEKVALDVAIGAAYAGKRAMAVMKHVGLNVAADSIFYAALTGLQAGLVLVVADDPGMHSSQGEQDSRRYAQFARVPCLDPSDSQEAKDMVAEALRLSEAYDTPVMLRLSTRISHSHSLVEPGIERQAQAAAKEQPEYHIDTAKYVMVPANARKRHPVMEERIERIARDANQFTINQEMLADPELGIVTSGVAYQYAKEVFSNASYFKLGMSFPLPTEAVEQFSRKVKRLLVVEELDPVIEEGLKLQGIPCEGKELFPLIGELNPELVRAGARQAGLAVEPLPLSVQPVAGLPIRQPVMCPGCPHRGVFAILRKLKVVVNGDIGCYSLGYSAPLGALHTCGCMGASIGQAHGVKKAGIKQANVAILGDSTFFHSGIPALLNAVYNHGSFITIILDNRTTAMTGHQANPGTGKTLQNQDTPAIELEPLVLALGIRAVYTIDSYNLDEIEGAIRNCLKLDGPSVIIAQRPCALLPEARKRYQPLRVDADKCIACGTCRRIGCPALTLSDEAYLRTGK
ncbi:MAG: indolepyruvate ferredoxin oxidoreductase subunit alpha, partial [Chloroflexi bacterium]|nr:indolepyruvate ferredoxin oxidoreductase subunit alpha [Chloroflexota bacterium]